MMTEKGKVSVLAVDDSKTMLAMIAAQLKDSNFEVVATASSGLEALEKYLQIKPQLVLLDIVMPEASGFEVLKFIRGMPELKHLPVVIFTGDNFPGNEQKSLALGANLFLLKPVVFQEVVGLARNLYELMRQMKKEGSSPSALSE